MTESAVPAYVPPHLRGRVGDFRNEPGGAVSFSDPQAALGLGPEESRKLLSRDQYNKTFDPNTRAMDLETSLRDQYASPIARYNAGGFPGMLRDSIANTVRSGLQWGTGTSGRSIGTGALLAALAGGVGGYALSRDGDHPWRNGLLAALVSGALGAGATAYAQHATGRQSSLYKTASTAEDMIIKAVASDNSMSREDKITLLRLAQDLRESDAAELARVLRGATGAGVGMLIVKFLKLKGLLPMVVGGMIGAALGGRASIKRNALGQVSI